jgi:aryl-alcohol dehydrogenase-like predicted oxidoreductase
LGSRATSKFAHFLEAEKALTPENVAASERFAAWALKHGVGTPAQLALAWVLKHDTVSSVITGATRVEQLEENLKALELKLKPSDWKAAEAAIKGPARSAKASKPAPAKRAAPARKAPAKRRKR